MNQNSTFLFIFENVSNSVQESLIPLLNNYGDLEQILPMESPSDEALQNIYEVINA
ncbi:MAG: hypothetical protein ACLFM1_08335 [Bacteroidales bacterium]